MDMSERFEVLYKLDNNLYRKDSPIVVSAGVLLKDTKTGKIVSQFKFQSVAKSRIIALKLSVYAYDVSGKSVESKDEYQYLDLSVNNGDFFGSDKAVIMPDIVTRSIRIKSISVVFEDDICEINGDDLLPIESQQSLSTMFSDSRLVKQYQLDVSTHGEYIPKTVGNLWFCACRKLNSTDICTCCGASKEKIFDALDPIALEEHLKLRLEKEKAEQEKKDQEAEIERKKKEERTRQEAERKAKEAAERTKKNILFSIITCFVIGVIVVSSVVHSSVKRKNARAEIENYIASEQYEHAFDSVMLNNLPDSENADYLNRIIPFMQKQWDAEKVNDEALRIDGLSIYKKDDVLFYYNSDNEKVILFDLRDEKDAYIRDDLIFANGYLFFVVSRDTTGDWDFVQDVKYVNIKTGVVHTLAYGESVYCLYKLKNGKIYVNRYFDDEIEFNPYDETSEIRSHVESQFLDAENLIYSTKLG